MTRFARFPVRPLRLGGEKGLLRQDSHLPRGFILRQLRNIRF